MLLKILLTRTILTERVLALLIPNFLLIKLCGDWRRARLITIRGWHYAISVEIKAHTAFILLSYILERLCG